MINLANNCLRANWFKEWLRLAPLFVVSAFVFSLLLGNKILAEITFTIGWWAWIVYALCKFILTWEGTSERNT